MDTSKPAPAPYKEFKTSIRKSGGEWVDINKFFGIEKQPQIENWNFQWVDSIETHYASVLNNSNKPIDVAVAARAWRKLKINEPGNYEVRVQYGPKQFYTVNYTIVDPKKPEKKAKNVILFISDGTNVGVSTLLYL